MNSDIFLTLIHFSIHELQSMREAVKQSHIEQEMQWTLDDLIQTCMTQVQEAQQLGPTHEKLY